MFWNDPFFAPVEITEMRWRRPLCPYLMTGNHRFLIHLDAFLIPQSLQWPAPGAPERIGKRNLCDEWPYWKDIPRDEIALQMPYFQYADGHRETLDTATSVAVDYIKDTNVLTGQWVLPGGAVIREIMFTPPDSDSWVRRYQVTGNGQWVLRGEFFDQAVPGHAQTELGSAGMRGFLPADPAGVFVLHFDQEMVRTGREYAFDVEDTTEITVYFSAGPDLISALKNQNDVRARDFGQLLEQTIQHDRAWIAKGKKPENVHPFLKKNYTRWLLSNYLLIGENGFSISGVRPFWTFAWPRDCCQQAIGLYSAGYVEEAKTIVEHLLNIVPENGLYDARYLYTGKPMLLDNRHGQCDHTGYVCFTAARFAKKDADDAWLKKNVEKIIFLADRLCDLQDPETGLMKPAADHRETQVSQNLSNVLAAAAGLREAAGLLPDSDARIAKYKDVSAKLLAAADQHLWVPEKKYYKVSVNPDRPVADISLCWGVYPFHNWEPVTEHVLDGVQYIFRDRWDQEHGGVVTSKGSPYASYWMYYASILLLGMYGIRDQEKADQIVEALAANATPQGLIPEQTSYYDGELIGCAPLPPPQANLTTYTFAVSNGEYVF